MRNKLYFTYFFILITGIFISSALLFNRFYEKYHGYSFFMKRPLISVVVTSYNYDKYIREALDSIFNQTYKNFEVIVVDDGSKDNSVNVIKEYVTKYDNIKLYQHENGANKGLPASVKLGVEKAKGDFVAFLESDDYWDKDCLLERVKFINKHKDAVIVSNGISVFGDYNEANAAKFYVDNVFRNIKEKNDFDLDIKSISNIIPTLSSVMIRRKTLKSLNYETPIPAYIDLWLYKQIRIDNYLYFLDEKLTFWRRHDESYNHTNKTENYKKNLWIFFDKLEAVINKK